MVKDDLLKKIIHRLCDTHEEYEGGNSTFDFEEGADNSDWSVFVRHVSGEFVGDFIEGYVMDVAMEEHEKLSEKDKNEIWRLAAAQSPFEDEDLYLEGKGIKKEDSDYFTYYDEEIVKYYLYDELEEDASNENSF
jgi:hypothetical protein